MKFQLFGPRIEPHIRKSLEYLKDAKLAQVEHQTAAEHHAALAKMYEMRIARIEAQMSEAAQTPSLVTHQRFEQVNVVAELPHADSVLVYPVRATRP